MFKRAAALFLAILFMLPVMTGCDERAENEKIKIVTTIFPQYDMVRIIGGDAVEAVKLLPWGSESHTYDPSIRDISVISDADVFIYNGNDAENWATELVEVAREEGCEILDLSSGVELLGKIETDASHAHTDGDGHNHGHVGDYDAHIWTNPENAIKISELICSVLCTRFPEKSEYFTANMQEYVTSLKALCGEYEKLSESYDGRTLYFGGRFAFLYLFDRYGFNYKSPYQGCGEESEPGIKTISDMCAEMKENGVRYIFREEMSDGKIAKSIAEETGAETVVLHSCHNLSLDEVNAGESYLSIMEKNLDALKKAMDVR